MTDLLHGSCDGREREREREEREREREIEWGTRREHKRERREVIIKYGDCHMII